jgi:DNA-binding response OmpR family regulator
MQNQNVVLTRYQLNEHIMKDFASMGNSNIIDAHIKNLRKKLKNCDFIKTVRGVGYTLKK